jgi:MFS family permease
VSAALVVLGVVVAVVAAIRSIWSPCGLSMLSTITPVAEAGRGHSFRSTSTWFVIGSVAGGLTLGFLTAGFATLVARLETTPGQALWIVALASLLAATSDGRLAGFHIPGHDRQVNERWLDRYRSWVYGAGFGWQIGVGLATYIMTSALYLLILIGGLTAEPVVAIALGALFGLVRGLAVYLATGLDSTERLLWFHSKFESRREPVRQATIVIMATVAVAAAASAGAPATILGAVVVLAAWIVMLSRRGPREVVYLNAAGAQPVN